jgi:hypothetical protein
LLLVARPSCNPHDIVKLSFGSERGEMAPFDFDGE